MSTLRVDPGTRKRGEFERRTAIFEGAYRAWSFLGGLEPEDIVGPSSWASSSQAVEADLLDRLFDHPSSVVENDGRSKKTYPCEPLPRVGLSHPYIQAILTPWLGPDTDKQVQKESLQSLRIWWQHRKAGESRTAADVFRKEAKGNVVDGYTRHFFRYAYCLAVHDNVQPPKSLFLKMNALEKQQKQQGQPKTSVKNAKKSAGNTTSPLAHLVQSKCVPSKVDLPAVVDAIDRQVVVPSSVHRGGDVLAIDDHDDTTTPVVFCSSNGDAQIAMSVDGIVCAHCVKIVETVLRGCDGRKSPIDGLLDAAVNAAVDRRDTSISTILIKIDRVSNAKRIAFEAARNLSLVGYIAKAKTMNVLAGEGSQKHGRRTDDVVVSTAFEAVAVNNNNGPVSVLFDWTLPCTCPDKGVFYYGSCQRHSQEKLSRGVLAAFTEREQQVKEYMATTGGSILSAMPLLEPGTKARSFTPCRRHRHWTSPAAAGSSTKHTMMILPNSSTKNTTFARNNEYIDHRRTTTNARRKFRPTQTTTFRCTLSSPAVGRFHHPTTKNNTTWIRNRSNTSRSNHRRRTSSCWPAAGRSSDLDGFFNNTMNWNGLDDGIVLVDDDNIRASPWEMPIRSRRARFAGIAKTTCNH